MVARGTVLGCVGFSLLASSWARELRAQEGDAPPPEIFSSEPAQVKVPEPEPAPPVPAPARPALAANSTPTASVELLGPQAYASRQPRGIPGGSLSSVVHGLQWPYLPTASGLPRTRLALSGRAWVDTSYRSLKGGSAADPDRQEWEQKTRFVLRATPTYSTLGGWFVQGQGELVLLGATPASAEESLGVDDLYLRVGRWGVFDVTAGRFQGWEVYHLGMGLEQNTTERSGASTALNPALDIGRDLQFLWDRRDGPGNIALHVYPLDYLRFELLGSVGGSGSRNQLGVRPAAILDFGILKAKIAADYVRDSARPEQQQDRTLQRGIVGGLQVVVRPWLEAGVAGGYALVDDYDAEGALNPEASNTTYGFGGFVSARVLEGVVLGAGGAYSHQRNLQADATGTLNDIETHTQLFGAAQYALWDQLYIKAVVAYADALFDPQSQEMGVRFHNESLGGRLRLAYWF